MSADRYFCNELTTSKLAKRNNVFCGANVSTYVSLMNLTNEYTLV